MWLDVILITVLNINCKLNEVQDLLSVYMWCTEFTGGSERSPDQAVRGTAATDRRDWLVP